ncbi:type II toxin-antitoxin system Phd/YefM family antitoxin [Streptacidiphilus cavernicola]|uniref:Antitoxin n=1 Tax=Streptacidiphilus cavernicola TaxID=3342716 RepID=A0ABV6W5J5_9ACTN
MRCTVPQPGGTVPLTWARANLGPLVRWTHTTGERTTITDRHGATAVLISAGELAKLQGPQAAACGEPTHCPEPGHRRQTR